MNKRQPGLSGRVIKEGPHPLCVIRHVIAIAAIVECLLGHVFLHALLHLILEIPDAIGITTYLLHIKNLRLKKINNILITHS